MDDWKVAVVVPIPKKGNLQLCDNWRGINLVEIVGEGFCQNHSRMSTGHCRTCLARNSMWLQKRKRMCGYDLHGSAVDGKDY